MTSIMEVLLLELLRKEGIVTDEQAVNITSAFQLFELLQQMKVVPPLTNADKKVIKDWEFEVGSRDIIRGKVNWILRYDLSKVENPSLKRILESLQNRVRELKINE